jgi:hypothetical protein
MTLAKRCTAMILRVPTLPLPLTAMSCSPCRCAQSNNSQPRSWEHELRMSNQCQRWAGLTSCAREIEDTHPCENKTRTSRLAPDTQWNTVFDALAASFYTIRQISPNRLHLLPCASPPNQVTCAETPPKEAASAKTSDQPLPGENRSTISFSSASANSLHRAYKPT